MDIYHTFNQQGFQVRDPCGAATNACYLKHGIHLDCRNTLSQIHVRHLSHHKYLIKPSAAGEAPAFISTGRLVAREEERIGSTFPMPTFARRPPTMSSFILKDTPQSFMVGQQRQQVSELQFDEFPSPSSFFFCVHGACGNDTQCTGSRCGVHRACAGGIRRGLRLRQLGMMNLHLLSSTKRLRQWHSTFTFFAGVVDVRATLHYTVDDSQCHYFVASQTTAPKDMFKGAVCGTILHEGRGLNTALDAHSLSLCTRRQFFTNSPRNSQRSTMLSWLRYSRESQARHTLTSSITSCAMTDTTLTSTMCPTAGAQALTFVIFDDIVSVPLRVSIALQSAVLAFCAFSFNSRGYRHVVIFYLSVSAFDWS